MVLPLAAIVSVEGGLRLAGWGYPTAYFLKAKTSQGETLLENESFTRKYFPPGLERKSNPAAIAARKPKNTIRIFLFGESAALGDPASAYGMGSILQMLLSDRIPGRTVEMVNVATTAINSHVIRDIAASCGAAQGDIWVVYMGNNEVTGPFGVGTVFGSGGMALPWIRASLALKSTRLGQAMEGAWQWLGAGRGPPRAWGGMEMFLERQVGPDDAGLVRVYQNFQANLEAILRLGTSSGARVLLCTVASNLKDCPPLASWRRPELSSADRTAWERYDQEGRQLQETGRFDAAWAAYGQAQKVDPGCAESWFRMGQCALALNRVEDAKTCFSKARDLDALRFRTDGSLNDILRKTAQAWHQRGVRLVDVEERLAALSAQHIPGEDWFFDHVHFNWNGNYTVAVLLAEAVAGWYPGMNPTAGGSSGPWLSSDQCLDRLAYTPWDRVLVLKEMSRRLELPPFSSQMNHAQRSARLAAQLEQWQQRWRESDPVAARRLYEQALTTSPRDVVLRERYISFLQTQGFLEDAIQQWHRVLEIHPRRFAAYYHMGNCLNQLNRPGEAADMFRRALRHQPSLVEARRGLATALDQLSRPGEAIEVLEEALRRRPDDVEARTDLGRLLLRLGRAEDARVQWERVLESQTNHLVAMLLLGDWWAARQRPEMAQRYYRNAGAADGQSALAQYRLGNALLESNWPEAMDHLQEAVRLNPDLGEARYSLGLALVKAGRVEEALAHFETAVRLLPDQPLAQLNYGVALAKQQRWQEATVAFQRALQLDPNLKDAARYLQELSSRKGP